LNGKSIVRWNATRHGISSPAPVVPGLEKTEEWQEHRDGILDNLSPVGRLEITLAERVAVLSWRLHRVTRYETETIALSQERVEQDIYRSRMRLRSFREAPYDAAAHPEDERLEANHLRATHNALSDFSSHADGVALTGEDATSIIRSVLVAAEKAIEAEIELEDLNLPGVPEDAYIEELLPTMSVEDVRGCVDRIARAANLDTERLLEDATETARLDELCARAKAEQTDVEVNVVRRNRILPDDKTLDKISRYEAHLSRQLYHALHELENLQKHRTTGRGTPLARVDVIGLPEG
jgi:hypothetical protein